MTYRCNACIISLVFAWNTIYNMREWLSGGAPPCQGGGRGFDPRLALSKITKRTSELEVLFLLSEKCGTLLDTQLLGSLGSISRDAKAPLGRASAKVHRTLWHPARALVKKSCHTNLINQCDSLNFNYKLLYILLILFNETLH